MKLSAANTVVAISLLSASPSLAVAVWDQCGARIVELGFTGSTTRDVRSACVSLNDYYLQCQPSTGATSTVTTPTSTVSSSGSTSSGTTCPNRIKFKFFGVNESGAEFGNTVIPGTLGTNYAWPSPSSIVPHNFMIYNGQTNSSTSEYVHCTWSLVMSKWYSFPLFPSDLRLGGKTRQPNFNRITIHSLFSKPSCRTSYTRAWTCTTSSGDGAVFGAISDPNNNVVIEMHQYLDSDGSGTSETCVSSTIGAERIADATTWLKSNSLKGVLGEIGAGTTVDAWSPEPPTATSAKRTVSQRIALRRCRVLFARCSSPVFGWAHSGGRRDLGGGTHFQSIEPPSGAAVSQIPPQARGPFL
ncbi:hypothetical protein M0805_005211 [Coniferiporia weirii]|nr:hypothetical protein M0805_005211 [Coniferiporia weirii]